MKGKGQTVEWVKTTDPYSRQSSSCWCCDKGAATNAAKLFMNYSISKKVRRFYRKRDALRPDLT